MKRDKLRKVIFLDEYLDSCEGYFHKWILYDGVQAIVEDVDGKINLIDYKDIQFKAENDELLEMKRRMERGEDPF